MLTVPDTSHPNDMVHLYHAYLTMGVISVDEMRAAIDLFGGVFNDLAGLLSPIADAISHAFTRTPDQMLADLFPAINTQFEECPARLCKSIMHLGTMIQHLNDAHRWEREKIADWLDTLDIDLTLQPAGTGR